MKFTKMHGLGNDFILIDCMERTLPRPSNTSKKLCHRRFGIGADQVLLLHKSKIADFRMRIFNADGGEVEMCGNGIRCLTKYIWDNKLSSKKNLRIETLAGIITVERAGNMVRVDMGEPVLEPERIPVNLSQKSKSEDSLLVTRHSSLIIDYPLRISDREFKITCVSMGNPHTIIFVKGIDNFPVNHYGPLIENHQLFPKRTNVEFIQVIDAGNIKLRVWERGSGETMACGTGASAGAVACHLKGLTGRDIKVHLPGGELFIEWSGKDNHIYMTGPAVEVFSGDIEL